jgi:hypothetical protein
VNRTVLLLVAIVAGATLLVSTGAFSSVGTDEVPDADIEMQPADGPNGDYALLNGTDEIELLLTDANPDIEGEGVSENSVTPIDRVFTITYTGDEYAEVWITDDADDVRFFRGDTSDASIEGRANNVTLAPDETLTVGLLVDTRGEHDVESAEQFTVNARLPEDTSDGESTETPTETPTPAPTEQEASTDGSGGGGGGGDSGTVQGLSVEISVVDASLSASTIDPGDSVTATAVVENPTSTAVTINTSLLVDGSAITGKEVTISAGSSRNITLDAAFDEPGTYDIDLTASAVSPDLGSDTADAGTLVVEATPTPTPTPTESGSSGGTAGTPTPTPPPTPAGGASQTDVGSPTENVSNAGPQLAVEEPLGVGIWPLLAVLLALALLLAALRVWRTYADEDDQ